MQKLVLIRIQITADALCGAVYGVLRADGNVLVRAQDTPFYIQAETAVCQDIQALVGVDTQDVHGQLLDGNTSVGAVFFCFLLKIGDNHAELLVAQLVKFIPEAVAVKVAD